MDVTPLQMTDSLPLTCTRLGTCCHGHHIYISAYELARVAFAFELEPKLVRDRHLDQGGTRLRFDGAVGIHGPPSHRKPACTLYDAETGCRVHAHRPLACRLYPLGRQRYEGAIRYYHPGQAMPCLTLCPSVSELPVRTVEEYLAEQQVSEHEQAHDGYAALAYGMVNAAVVVTSQGGGSLPELATYFATIRQLDGDGRAHLLGAAWLDALTIPNLDAKLTAADFVSQHGHLLAQRFHHTYLNDPAPDALTRAAQMYVLLALHLSYAVGAEPAIMAQLIAPPA
jgi:Fe-S-cluster containining protein